MIDDVMELGLRWLHPGHWLHPVTVSVGNRRMDGGSLLNEGEAKIGLFKTKTFRLLLVFGQIQQPATRTPILIKQKTQT